MPWIRTVGVGEAAGRLARAYRQAVERAGRVFGIVRAMSLHPAMLDASFEELARRYQVLDYKRFCKVYLGPFWFLFEIGFIYGVVLTLSVVAAAALAGSVADVRGVAR